jgi:hypothetical protein
MPHAPSTTACGGRARPAADGQRRLERWHEPRRHEGRGESVWLGWFLCRLVADFAPLARSRGDRKRAAALGQAARAGPPRWRARAGTAPGIGGPSSTTASLWVAAANAEARIDLIAQAWAVLSGIGARAPAGRDGRGTGASGGPGGRADQVARPAAGACAAQCGLHPGLPTRRAGKRWPVHPRRSLGPDGPGRAGAGPAAGGIGGSAVSATSPG